MTLFVLAVGTPVVAQIDNGDGTVLSVRTGGPVRVVTGKRWVCNATDADVRISGYIGQFVSEQFDGLDRSDRSLKDFTIKAFPQIKGNPSLTYAARPVSGSGPGPLLFIFTWQSDQLRLNLDTRLTAKSTFDLFSNGKAVAIGTCSYQSEAFRPPA